jgi:xanthine dehydrogenase/oxidase
MGSLTREPEDTAAAEEWSDEAVFYVNGVRRVLPDGLAHLTLLQYLRGRALSHSHLLCVFLLFLSKYAED